MLLLSILAVCAVQISVNAYSLTDEYNADNFFGENNFRFYEGWDRFTLGLADYVNKTEAEKLELAKLVDGKVYLGVDATQTLSSLKPGKGNGRKSVRLEGSKTIDNGLVIADFAHLPAGACGMWPAL